MRLQEAYETQCRDVFSALQEMDDRLASRRYLIDNHADGAAPPVSLARCKSGNAFNRLEGVVKLHGIGRGVVS